MRKREIKDDNVEKEEPLVENKIESIGRAQQFVCEIKKEANIEAHKLSIHKI